ncbi:MAG: type II toxin-antitoxin system Phd/YefM family antitoxin [Candidatus Dormibacteraceae bacterium]
MRTLNQQTAAVFLRVERGETVEVTRHGRVVGRITPALSGELDDLIASGRITPATAKGPFIAPSGSPYKGPEAGELIRQLRDEEKW